MKILLILLKYQMVYEKYAIDSFRKINTQKYNKYGAKSQTK